jgi:hypothetical protein
MPFSIATAGWKLNRCSRLAVSQARRCRALAQRRRPAALLEVPVAARMVPAANRADPAADRLAPAVRACPAVSREAAVSLAVVRQEVVSPAAVRRGADSAADQPAADGVEEAGLRAIAAPCL